MYHDDTIQPIDPTEAALPPARRIPTRLRIRSPPHRHPYRRRVSRAGLINRLTAADGEGAEALRRHVHSRLKKIFPHKIHSVLAIGRRARPIGASTKRLTDTESEVSMQRSRSIGSGDGARPPEAVVAIAPVDDPADGSGGGALSGALADTVANVAEDTVGALAEGAPGTTSFIIVLRTRRVATVCSQINCLFKDDLPSRAEPAPHPSDVYWPSLRRPQLTAALVEAAAWAGLVVLFLFWLPLVSAVQTLVSLQKLEDIFDTLGLDALAAGLQGMGHSTRALVEGWLPSLVLLGLQSTLLYSGLLRAASRMMGHVSSSTLDSATLDKMWLYNFVVVLLGSCIVGSLFSTLNDYLRDGLCPAINALGGSVRRRRPPAPPPPPPSPSSRPFTRLRYHRRRPSS